MSSSGYERGRVAGLLEAKHIAEDEASGENMRSMLKTCSSNFVLGSSHGALCVAQLIKARLTVTAQEASREYDELLYKLEEMERLLGPLEKDDSDSADIADILERIESEFCSAHYIKGKHFGSSYELERANEIRAYFKKYGKKT